MLAKLLKCLISFPIFITAQTSFSLDFFQFRLADDTIGFKWPLKTAAVMESRKPGQREHFANRLGICV